MLDDAFCPHCHHLLLRAAPHPYPPRPLRCPSCHLLVGPGRAQDAGGKARRLGQTSNLRVDAVLDVLHDMQLGTRYGDEMGVGSGYDI
ncbi:hypothetical protein [Patulibacter defluvii]|uniref:hypothetical protein n=1 Tax=Patulibacter defluvii TaxID=3095358 RepID=UPI002A74D12F|nr:hypothetical protein [Patulibacter sp. DM4]